MATEDFGIKFDLFHEQKLGKTLDLDLIRDLGDSFIDFDIDNTTVPDISDQFFNFDPAHIDEHSSQLDCDELLSNLTSSDCCKKHEIDLDLDSLDSGDPLRHDCMWSGLCPSEEHRNIAKKDQLPSSSTSSSSSVNSVFDTPLQSDFETSDMDETFSEASSDAAEADPEPIQKMPSVTMDHMYGDHCYTSCQPAPLSSSVTLKPTSIAKIRDTETPRDRVTIKSPAVTSRAKFRFQMKFLTGRSNTRPLLAHPSRINRTHYHKRKAAIKNSFCQSPMKSIQIEDKNKVGKYVKIAAGAASVNNRGDKHRDIRDLHNSMERQRRIDLKRAFDGLKICVPELAESDKASKLMILDKAADFCQMLKLKELNLSSEKDRERKKCLLLKKKLQMLEKKSPKSLQVRCRSKRFL